LRAIFLRSSLVPRFAVDTMFWSSGIGLSGRFGFCADWCAWLVGTRAICRF
jgi:hypothetical protein